MDKQIVIKKLIKYFESNSSVLTVYLFGSFITEKFNKNSDIDLSLLLDPSLTKMELFDIKLKVMDDLERMFNRKFDIVIFNTAPLKLKHQIIKGKLILEKDRKFRVEEEVRAIREYLDMKDIYKRYESQMGKVILNGQ